MIAGLVAAALAGVMAGRYLVPGGGDEADGARKPLYWVAPMDPSFRSDRPGKSPMGMELVPVYPGDAHASGDAPGTVLIDPAVVNNLGVKTAAAEQGTLHQRISTVGYVQYDEDELEHVHTRTEGWIEKLNVLASGDPVKKGQVLFELYSRPLVTAQEELLAAKKRGSVELLAASRERLASLGMAADQIERLVKTGEVSRLVPVTSTVDGFVSDLKVRQGMFVKPDMDVMTVAALDTVWIIGEVFERQVATLQVGQPADVQFDYLPGRSWRGAVDYIYPELDPKTRTARVRIQLPNPGVILKPNMFADLLILGPERADAVSVPREALIRGSHLDRVVLATGDGRFQAVPVQVGIESGDRVEILSGVDAGQRVVVSGQFLIDSEANLEAEMLRAGEAEPESPPAHQHDHGAGGGS